jgi:hypothetical protein
MDQVSLYLSTKSQLNRLDTSRNMSKLVIKAPLGDEIYIRSNIEFDPVR